jgi:hypothetical protein
VVVILVLSMLSMLSMLSALVIAVLSVRVSFFFVMLSFYLFSHSI